MPKIVNRDKKRSEIAQKAIEILAKRGFQATTIQDIADASGLGKGTIYHYFKTRLISQVSG
jgi:AcrR family transcriptional regulator